MMETLLSAAFAPFTLALALVLGLLVLEVVLGFLGGSLLAGGADAVDLDTPDLEVVDFGADIDAADLTTPDQDAIEIAPVSGVSSFLGLGKTPFMIWLASAVLGFGITGFVVQTLTGGAVPATLAALPALIGGWAFARGFGGLFARLIPRDETQSVSETQLGRRQGVITQGNAARGKPAEVRVTDRHGNVHYLRAEPLQDDAVIAQGTSVLVMRDLRNGVYKLVATD